MPKRTRDYVEFDDLSDEGALSSDEERDYEKDFDEDGNVLRGGESDEDGDGLSANFGSSASRQHQGNKRPKAKIWDDIGDDSDDDSEDGNKFGSGQGKKSVAGGARRAGEKENLWDSFGPLGGTSVDGEDGGGLWDPVEADKAKKRQKKQDQKKTERVMTPERELVMLTGLSSKGGQQLNGQLAYLVPGGTGLSGTSTAALPDPITGRLSCVLVLDEKQGAAPPAAKSVRPDNLVRDIRSGGLGRLRNLVSTPSLNNQIVEYGAYKPDTVRYDVFLPGPVWVDRGDPGKNNCRDEGAHHHHSYTSYHHGCSLVHTLSVSCPAEYSSYTAVANVVVIRM